MKSLQERITDRVDRVVHPENIGKVKLVKNIEPRKDITSLKVARRRLDFNVRPRVGIRYLDMITEARKFFDRESIKDIGDLSAGECKRFGKYLIVEMDRLRKEYPFWRN